MRYNSFAMENEQGCTHRTDLNRYLLKGPKRQRIRYHARYKRRVQDNQYHRQVRSRLVNVMPLDSSRWAYASIRDVISLFSIIHLTGESTSSPSRRADKSAVSGSVHVVEVPIRHNTVTIIILLSQGSNCC